MTLSELRIAVASDIHLGHKRTRTLEIIKNLRDAFPDNAETAELHILFLAGDVFDDLLSLCDDEVFEIDRWIGHLLRVCKKHDILIRVLEGTPRHDWKQSQRFVAINEVAEIGADLKYVKELSIEYIERYGISVLYVPDEWRDTTEKTLDQVHDLLRAKGLVTVDFAIMHGQFEHQLPEIAKAPVHNAEAYHAIVKELIFIGHVHTFSQYSRIIAQGSFDRISHGEENPKGHVRAVIRTNGEHAVTFVENKNAKKYITVNCTGLTLDETLRKIEISADKLPMGSFIRVEANHDNPIFTNMELLIRHYPLLTWNKKVQEEKEAEKTFEEDDRVFIPITLTKDNLSELLLERIAHMGVSAEVMKAASDILKERL